MIRPTKGRILVKMIPATDSLPNSLGLTLIDKTKHFNHASRKGVVAAVGADITIVKVGETLVFRGDAGFTLDGDPEVDRAEYGTEYRWLKEHECLAIEEPIPQDSKVLAEVAS